MSDASFLPEDYLAKQSERRTNIISLVLFVVVMGAVFGAFLVTNRQASLVKETQAEINQQFKDAALKVEELNELEQQREKMLHKAELATALLERVPRSILLAELINRMPDRLSLQEFELKSTIVKKKAPVSKDDTKSLSKGKKNGPDRPKTREEAMEERQIEVPEQIVEVVMIGIAPTDLEVSNYIAQLNAYPLAQRVTLKYSIQVEIDERMMREFRVELALDPKADIRQIDPLIVPREMRDPMSEDVQFEIPPIDNGDVADDTNSGASDDRSANVDIEFEGVE